MEKTVITKPSITKSSFWGDILFKVISLSDDVVPEGKIAYSHNKGKDSVELCLFDENENMYKVRHFRKEDADMIVFCAETFMTKFCAHAEETHHGPWWSHMFTLGEIVEKEKDTLKTLKLFSEKMYVCQRYRWEQQLLWKDMCKDYNTSTKQFFVGCSEPHVGILLRIINAHLGYRLDNVEGD